MEGKTQKMEGNSLKKPRTSVEGNVEKKTASMIITCKPSEKAFYNNEAEKAGLCLATYLRLRLQGVKYLKPQSLIEAG